jgi:hypothetical protein
VRSINGLVRACRSCPWLHSPGAARAVGPSPASVPLALPAADFTHGALDFGAGHRSHALPVPRGADIALRNWREQESGTHHDSA